MYRHFPLTSVHAHALKAAEAAEAAGAQGAFWEYHDLLFENQDNFAGGDAGNARDLFIQLADELNLDVDKFTQELDDGVYESIVLDSAEEAASLGITGTPAVIFDGDYLQQLPPSFYYWDAIVQLKLLEDRQYNAPPSMSLDPDKSYGAIVTMAGGGSFKLELFPESAPQTVNSFVFLAREGWYDGVTFHRVLPGFVAQTGDPTGTGVGGPGYTLPDEVDPQYSHAEAGMLSMAKSNAPNSAGSQWYITLADASFLDGTYSIFGRVTEGMDVVMALSPRDPQKNPEAPAGDMIETIEIVEE